MIYYVRKWIFLSDIKDEKGGNQGLNWSRALKLGTPRSIIFVKTPPPTLHVKTCIWAHIQQGNKSLDTHEIEAYITIVIIPKMLCDDPVLHNILSIIICTALYEIRIALKGPFIVVGVFLQSIRKGEIVRNLISVQMKLQNYLKL